MRKKEQASQEERDALRAVLEPDGARGLFTRGLSTRLCTNGAQSVIFAVVWRHLA